MVEDKMTFTANLKSDNNIFVQVDLVIYDDSGYGINVIPHLTIEEKDYVKYGELLALLERNKIIFLYGKRFVENHNCECVEFDFENFVVSYCKNLFVNFGNSVRVHYESLYLDKYSIES